MTKLPEKELLSGSKMPRTTTGEMKTALGRVRDYLAELFGDDSENKEAARKTLGIDLSSLAVKPDVEADLFLKADKTEMEKALSQKAGKNEVNALEKEISKRGIPVGSIDFFAMVSPPEGYLKADGAAVGRETYPDLFAAIGTTFGEGDGESTFNLPDLIDRFAQGSATPGQKILAGLPNIEGKHSAGVWAYTSLEPSGSFYKGSTYSQKIEGGTGTFQSLPEMSFDASRSSPIYGASGTVQPPALTLLPCIKAFDAATHHGLVDVTVLADDINTKLDKAGGRMSGTIYFGESGDTGVGYDEWGQIVLTSKGGNSPVSLALGNDGSLWMNGQLIRYVTEAYNDDANWFRRWSDGWLEQGGRISIPGNNGIKMTLMRPYSAFFNAVASPLTNNAIFYQGNPISVNTATLTVLSIGAFGGMAGTVISWQACGR